MKNFLLLFTLPIFLWSQNLNELIDLAQKNKLVNSYNYGLDSLKDEYKSVKQGYLPSVDIGANYAQAKNEISSVADKTATAHASVSYTLYDGGKREDTYKSYESNIKSSEENIVAIKNQIALDVINYYYNYFSLLAQKEAKLKEIEQLNAQYERLKKFYDVGTTTEDELQKIISNVESANVNLHEIELNIQTILHNLEYIIGQRVDLTTGSTIKESSEVKESLRADIKALEYNLDTRLNEANIEKSTNLPTINLDNTYTYYDIDFKNNAYSYPIDDQNIFSVNLQWNIFSFGETKSRYESKYKEFLSAKSQYEYEKNKANVDLQLAKKSYEIAKLKIKSAEASLKAAQTAYEVIKSKYQNGLIDNVAYLQSLSEKFDAISTLKAATFDLEVKKANIIYHSGENLKDYIQ